MSRLESKALGVFRSRPFPLKPLSPVSRIETDTSAGKVSFRGSQNLKSGMVHRLQLAFRTFSDILESAAGLVGQKGLKISWTGVNTCPINHLAETIW